MVKEKEWRLTGLAFFSRLLDEAVVERQVVTNRVLPALFVVVVIGEVGHDEFVNSVQRDFLLGRSTDGHSYQRNVAVWRLPMQSRGFLRDRSSGWHNRVMAWRAFKVHFGEPKLRCQRIHSLLHLLLLVLQLVLLLQLL